MAVIKVGTCGWSVRGGRSAYYRTFPVIELQETFYNLMPLEKARKLREEAPQGFEFTMKVWQVITHPHTSPTWRRLKEKPPGNLENYGFLKPTKENFDAWEKVREVAKELGAKVCVFQTPPSFGYSEENLRNVKEFFSSISRDGIVIAWEPRGSWNQKLDVVAEVVNELGIVHVVDPLKRDSVSKHPVAYFRLHGLGPGEVNYRYRYSDDDLRKLCEIVKVKYGGKDVVYVLFNNIYMAEDAKRFREICKV